jgi:hypothetical protein
MIILACKRSSERASETSELAQRFYQAFVSLRQ